ncbi:hypothetical protein ACA910_008602 [Epithemia clementina (nom. ined.)]
MSVYSSSKQSRYSGSPHKSKRAVDDGPIAEFVKVIDNTPSGAWQKRATAFENLIKQIPEGSDYYSGHAWYNNPPTLRHLANPLSELLKDARSTVVKRTCGSLLGLFSRCQADARYLFKDLMPTVLSVHAQTVQVIRQAVQYMVMEAIPEVPCKMVMPLWMERLKIDKSRTVRDACALYLGHALQCWTEEGYLTEEIWMQVGKCLISSLRDPSPTVRTNIKAALEIMQRMQPVHYDNLINDPEGLPARDAKLARWLTHLGQGFNPDTEELSIMSRISYNSDIRTTGRKAGSSGASVGSHATPRRPMPSPRTDTSTQIPSHIALGRRSSPLTLPPSSGNTNLNGAGGGGFAMSSSSSVGASKKPTGLAAPPMRRSDLLARRPDSTPGTPQHGGTGVSNSVIVPASPLQDPVSPIPTDKSGDAISFEQESEDMMLFGPPQKTLSTDGPEPGLSPTAFPADLGVPGLRESMQGSGERKSSPGKPQNSLTVDTSMDRRPVSSNGGADSSNNNMAELSQRRNRNSVLIQQRLRMSSSNVDDHDDDFPPENGNKNADNENNAAAENGQNGTKVPKPPKFPSSKNNSMSSDSAAPMAAVVAALPSSPSVVPPPEHMVIAIRLLKAHKSHVDAIMETLRIEMDTLRDFDRLLEEPGRPTEDEVLDYFESVGLCLEQRTLAGVQMQEELDRVSRGEPPSEE